jgi:murein peptide amidase A
MSEAQRLLPVKAAPLHPREFLAHFEASACARGFRIEEMGAAEGCPLLAFTRRTTGTKPRIYLSAGVHGDEPAPPFALARLLADGVFDDRAVWFLVPLINPGGLIRGTRESPAGVDLNRDYRNPQTPEVRAHVRWLERQPGFTVSFCLHEDWESQGFYLYELNPANRPSLAPAMLAAVAARFPIDRSPSIDGRPAEGGVIRPVSDPHLRNLWPEAIYLRSRHTTLSYTLESPSALPLESRIEMLTTALRAALGNVLAG